MVSTILKVLGAEASIGTGGSDFSGKTLIRVYNSTNADVTITIKDAASATTGSFTLRTYETVFVRKLPAESIFSSATVKMVGVAF